MPRKKENQHHMTITLDTQTYRMLGHLKLSQQVSAAQVIRSSIRDTFDMRMRHLPRCASSENCRCPNMHQWPDTPVFPAGGEVPGFEAGPQGIQAATE